MFLNTCGNRSDIADDLSNVLEYLRTGNATDDFTRELERQVVLLNEDVDWRDRHMTLEAEFQHRYHIGFDDGLQRGIEDTLERVIRTLISKKMTPEEIMEITGCTQNDIDKVLLKK